MREGEREGEGAPVAVVTGIALSRRGWRRVMGRIIVSSLIRQ